jgi:hypothetical protein
LFYSTDGGNFWNRDDAFPGMPYISSMTQTENGTVFVATGSNEEQWAGNGLFYKTAGSDTWQTVPGTSNLSRITEVDCAENSNKIFIATSTGLKTWSVGDASMQSISITGGGGSCDALKVSKDGNVVVISTGGTGKTFVSNDGGASFTDKSGSDASGKVPAGAPRIEYTISSSKNASNNYTIYAIRTNSNLLGMHLSKDNGQTWAQFIGSSGSPSVLDIYRNQGTYNSIASVDPRNTERLLIGGIDVWEWNQTVNNPPAGGFEQLSQWFLHPTNELYVHADNHEMKWDQNDVLYLGNDGGISISTDYGTTFYPANRGYNVTQFYGIAFDRHGAVIGGTQDNGTLYNDFSNASYKEFSEVGGGDGFECEISFYNPNVMFTSVYYNSISRSGDKGQSFTTFEPPFPATYGATGVSGSEHPFHTEFAMAEYFDPNSRDSVTFSPKANYAPNSVVRVPSMATGDTISYTTPVALYYDDTLEYDPNLTQTDYKIVNAINGSTIDLGQNSFTIFYDANPAGLSVGDSLTVNGSNTAVVESLTSYSHYFGKNSATNEVVDMLEEEMIFNVTWDTIQVADPYQSWFFVYTAANGGEIWGTRDALRLSVLAPTWVNLATGIGGSLFSSIDIEFSKDLNNIYISTGSSVWRIDGLGSMYTQDATFNDDVLAAGAAKVEVSTQNCEGIALNPNNANDLIILPQSTSGNILRSNNAASVNPSFTTLSNNVGVFCYDAIIDCRNPEIIVVATAFGVKASDDGGDTEWTDCSTGFENVPVYEIRQSWRSWAEGNHRQGEIYIGTFGRGIWASTDLLGLNDPNNEKYKKINTDLKVYPNPTNGQAFVSFNLLKAGNVSIQVYNLAGVLVKSMTVKNLNKGEQSIDIDASDFNRGTYIVKFNSSTYNETVKFVKL